MAIDAERVGDLVILTPGERLDVTTGPVLEELVDELFAAEERRILIDLADVNYVSSIGLSACLRSAQLAQAQGGRVVLTGLREPVREVFGIAGLDRVIDIYPSREHGLASFGTVQPQPASGARVDGGRLTLPEEVLLLALQDEGGRVVDLPEYALDFALSGAVLVELCRRRRVDADPTQLIVVDDTPLRDAILDPALAAIRRAHRTWPAEHWVNVLAREGAEIRQRVVERLVERGVLRRQGKLLHWMLGGRRYPMADQRDQREVKTRVLGVLKRGEIPSPQDVAVIALADACAVFDAILEMDEMLEVRPRITEVAGMDLLVQAITRALGDMQSWGEWEGRPEGVYGRTSDAAR